MDTINQINATPINSAAYAPAIQGNQVYNNNSGGSMGGGSSYTPTNNSLQTLLNTQSRRESGATIGSEIQVEAGSGRVVATSNNVDKQKVQNAVNNAIASNSNISDLRKRGSITANSSGEWFIKDQYGADFIKRWLKSKGFKILNEGQKGLYIGSGTVNFKSGGYTGDWSGQGVDGMGGRMAVLHQKELVLNESDTSNMLAAVEALRQMNIDKLAQSILATSIATAQMQIQTQLLSAQLSGLRDQYESSRNTTINADFSGVRTADEILRAFEELENYGLQQYNTGDASYRSY